MFRRLAGTTAIAASAAVIASQLYVYPGQYYEKPPFDPKKLDTLSRVKYTILGSNDDINSNKAWRICNPNNNPAIYDYFEQEIDPETSKKILAKYKTNEELLGAMQKALFLGPTLWPHRFVISPYLKSKSDTNRISGFTAFQPALKSVQLEKQPTTALFGIPLLPQDKQLKYVWDASDIEKLKKPMDPNTIIFGMFSFIESGKRSNGGFFNFAVGSDLFPDTMIHRVEYYKKKNAQGEECLVFRLTNATVLIPPKSGAPIDNTHGLHEFMTRTMVLDMARGIEY